MVGAIAHQRFEEDINLNRNDTYISYLPLPHVLERIFVCCILYCGGRIGFYSGDVQ
jgi:long-chain acyl-CoA synthetase